MYYYMHAATEPAHCDQAHFAIIVSIIECNARVIPIEFAQVTEIHPVLFEVAAPFGFVPFEFHETTN